MEGRSLTPVDAHQQTQMSQIQRKTFTNSGITECAQQITLINLPPKSFSTFSTSSTLCLKTLLPLVFQRSWFQTAFWSLSTRAIVLSKGFLVYFTLSIITFALKVQILWIGHHHQLHGQVSSQPECRGLVHSPQLSWNNQLILMDTWRGGNLSRSVITLSFNSSKDFTSFM